MKILTTGGGTGGHVFPVIAVIERIREVVREDKLVEPTIYFMAPEQYVPKALFENKVIYMPCTSGKLRRYFSLRNLFDIPKTVVGGLKGLLDVYQIFPDVVFAKGGYASFPALFAARVLGIPVVIHESDSKPGRVSAWAGKFATRIALSYPSAATYFPRDRVAVTGNPVRREISVPEKEGGYEFFKLTQGIPTLLILGGSQGAARINELLIDALGDLVSEYQIIHQTGKKTFKEVQLTAQIVLEKNPHKDRYRVVEFLNDRALSYAAGIADLIISRAGSTIFEIALWGKPSIIIPIPVEISHDQTSNAFAYKAAGACEVIEEKNLSQSVFKAEISRILNDTALHTSLSEAARAFSRPDAAHKIARAVIEVGITHETK
jgi:UDP-N-acetylglucosamine--N-acetylmuramyl-(pentapeptide) pyrophosphoryl-undecaprenol N-acetylglucosamine transferase